MRRAFNEVVLLDRRQPPRAGGGGRCQCAVDPARSTSDARPAQACDDAAAWPHRHHDHAVLIGSGVKGSSRCGRVPTARGEGSCRSEAAAWPRPPCSSRPEGRAHARRDLPGFQDTRGGDEVAHAAPLGQLQVHHIGDPAFHHAQHIGDGLHRLIRLDRHRQGPGEQGQPFPISRRHRLFHQRDVVRLDPIPGREEALRAVGLVRIERQRDAAADRRAHLGHALGIDRAVTRQLQLQLR